MFEEWVLERNVSAEEQCSVDLVQKPDPKLLNFWLCQFVTEVRKKDGLPYPPCSIHLILAGLQMHRRFLTSQTVCIVTYDGHVIPFFES